MTAARWLTASEAAAPFAYGGANLTGKTFGHLTVLEVAGKFNRYIYWRCICECGKETTTRTGQLTSGNARSCGCLRLAAARRRVTTLGMRRSREYKAWINMRGRCANPKLQEWKHYGGRGIRVCERWHDFAAFYADMGIAPKGLSLDRIDNDGPYCPENCRWATQSTQMRNTRANRLLTWMGRTQTIKGWSEDLGFHYSTLYMRIRTGWPTERALTTPARAP